MVYNKYKGNDNYGNPKQKFLDELRSLDDANLRKKCSEYIWLSAYASNNPRSDYHWQCDACYDECQRRDKSNIYSEEHAKLVAEARGY